MTLAYRISRMVAWMLLRFWCRARATGREQVPAEGPVLLVSNHASYLDPPLVGTWSPRQVRFLARDTLAKVPVLAGWMRSVGTVFVDRKAPAARSMQVMIEELKAGRVACVFAEGTRTRDGDLAEFKRGLVLLAKKTGATVVPTGIEGSFKAFPRGRRVPRLFSRCTVHFGAPMSASEVMAAGGLEVLRQRVAELSGQKLAVGDGEAASNSDGNEATPSAKGARSSGPESADSDSQVPASSRETPTV